MAKNVSSAFDPRSIKRTRSVHTGEDIPTEMDQSTSIYGGTCQLCNTSILRNRVSVHGSVKLHSTCVKDYLRLRKIRMNKMADRTTLYNNMVTQARRCGETLPQRPQFDEDDGYDSEDVVFGAKEPHNDRVHYLRAIADDQRRLYEEDQVLFASLTMRHSDEHEYQQSKPKIIGAGLEDFLEKDYHATEVAAAPIDFGTTQKYDAFTENICDVMSRLPGGGSIHLYDNKNARDKQAARDRINSDNLELEAKDLSNSGKKEADDFTMEDLKIATQCHSGKTSIKNDDPRGLWIPPQPKFRAPTHDPRVYTGGFGQFIESHPAPIQPNPVPVIPFAPHQAQQASKQLEVRTALEFVPYAYEQNVIKDTCSSARMNLYELKDRLCEAGIDAIPRMLEPPVRRGIVQPSKFLMLELQKHGDTYGVLQYDSPIIPLNLAPNIFLDEKKEATHEIFKLRLLSKDNNLKFTQHTWAALKIDYSYSFYLMMVDKGKLYIADEFGRKEGTSCRIDLPPEDLELFDMVVFQVPFRDGKRVVHLIDRISYADFATRYRDLQCLATKYKFGVVEYDLLPHDTYFDDMDDIFDHVVTLINLHQPITRTRYIKVGTRGRRVGQIFESQDLRKQLADKPETYEDSKHCVLKKLEKWLEGALLHNFPPDSESE